MKTIKALIAATVLLIGAAALARAFLQRQTAHRIGIASPSGIDALEEVSLGGVPQWIQIRGWDRRKPLLLFLHGGPGFPQMPFAHQNAALEKNFVVVQWDQRGAGKSFSRSLEGDALKIEQFVSDTHELVELLLKRFGTPKCFLVAHSWGTIVGALTVSRYPELFHAYVGIGQVASIPKSQQVRYHFALGSAESDGNAKAIRELRAIGIPPYGDFENADRLEAWVLHYSKREHQPLARSRFIGLAFASPIYSWADLVRIPLGARFSFARLWRESFYNIDLFHQVPRMDVPVFFFEGRYDTVVTAEVTENYFRSLDAPRGKQMIWFEKSGHWPHFEEPQKYRATLVGTVLGRRD